MTRTAGPPARCFAPWSPRAPRAPAAGRGSGVYDANRGAARSLFRALVAARDAAWQGMDETASLRFMLPWLATELEATRAVLGNDYWSSGLAGNEKTLATLRGA